MRSAITIGVAIGTTTFFLFAVAWVIAWILTIHEEKRASAARSAGSTPIAPQDDRQPNCRTRVPETDRRILAASGTPRVS
jgi:hypothetical protein